MGRASSAGIELAISVVACMLLGYWLDGKFDTEPWLTMIGLIIGSVVGFRALWQAAQISAEGEDE